MVEWKQVAGAVVGVVVTLSAVGLIAARSKEPPAPLPTAAPPTPAPQAGPTIAERIAGQDTLAGVLPILLPLMGDSDGESVSLGGSALAQWWSQRPNLWPELLAMPDTLRAEIMKDPDPWRGQRLCVTGTVVQIARDRTLPYRMYAGVLSVGGGVIRFIAIQSTQGIVEQTLARFCGIVIGTQRYSTAIGGSMTGVQVVGVFDTLANGGKGVQTDEGY